MSNEDTSHILNKLCAEAGDPMDVRAASQASTLDAFTDKDWYQELPGGTATLWPSFSPEARAVIVTLAQDALYWRNYDSSDRRS